MSADTVEAQTLSAAEVVTQAVERARKASRSWGNKTAKERAKHLLAFRDALIDQTESITETVGKEVDKPRLDVVNELLQACTLIGYYASHGPKYLKPQKVPTGLLMNKRAWIERHPMGVVGIITPWNYPVLLVLSPIIQALIAGNTVVLKPSERTTQTAKKLHEIFQSLGLDPDIFQFVEGGPEEAVALAKAKVDKLSFTGGKVGGQAILKAAADNLTPVLLELGGNDAMIVAEDADVERAAHGAVWGAFLNVGQSCIAVERCFVAEPLFDSFLERVRELTERITQGLSAATSPEQLPKSGWDHDVGPLVSATQYQRVHQMVEQALSAGAKVVAGNLPDLPDDLQSAQNRCFPPMVLTNVTPDMQLMQEETFGPVLPIVPFRDIEEAVRQANDSPFGLAASVWSKDKTKARQIASQLNVGGVVINDCLVHFAINALPFGGVKESGFGRTHGKEGLYEFCSTRTVTEHRFGPRLELQWFPYKGKHRLMARIARLLFRRGLGNKLK